MEEVRSDSPAATYELGRRFARRLKRGDCVAIVGPLGAGKTILVKGIAAGLGLSNRRLVLSPTFVLVQEYPARLPVFHVDLYRLADAGRELASLGMEEMLTEGVVLIEWADRAGQALPPARWELVLSPVGKTLRLLQIIRHSQ